MSVQQTEATEKVTTEASPKPSPAKAPRRDKASKAARRPTPAKERATKPKQGAGKGGKPARGTRSGTKQEQLIAMLRRSEGATVEEVVKALGWQPHTVRGAISGALRKKLGLKIESEKVEERGRVYRIVD